MESIWGDFYGVRATGNRPVPFLDAFPLTIWMHTDPTLNLDSTDKIANVQVLASVTNLISVQINQYQANFLTKISKSLSEVGDLAHPSHNITMLLNLLIFFALS